MTELGLGHQSPLPNSRTDSLSLLSGTLCAFLSYPEIPQCFAGVEFFAAVVSSGRSYED